MTKKYTLQIIVLTAIVAVLTSAIMGAVFWRWLMSNPEAFSQVINPAILANQNAGPTLPLYQSESVIVDTVRKTDPAVVTITVSKNVPVYEQYYRSIPTPLKDFFGEDFFKQIVPEMQQNGTQLQEIGGGSGFLVSSDGYIVTNRHVVADQEAEYTVFTTDNTKYQARVIARDPILDLAILKIDGSAFPYLPFGNSDEVKVGQSVIAIGNALAEFRNTVSVGVISGLSRSIMASDMRGQSEALDQLIQTDAAINQGNSGGPLLNLSGEVIGINVAIASGAENVGFALSANSVKNVVEQVQKTGKIVRPYLGVRYVPVNEEIIASNQLSVDYGVLVQPGRTPADLPVIPGSPADKAGIVVNDVIEEFDDVKLTNDTSLASLIRNKKVGDKVTLKVNHAGEEKIVTVELEAMN